jgi:hypothetical protein
MSSLPRPLLKACLTISSNSEGVDRNGTDNPFTDQITVIGMQLNVWMRPIRANMHGV